MVHSDTSCIANLILLLVPVRIISGSILLRRRHRLLLPWQDLIIYHVAPILVICLINSISATCLARPPLSDLIGALAGSSVGHGGSRPSGWFLVSSRWHAAQIAISATEPDLVLSTCRIVEQGLIVIDAAWASPIRLGVGANSVSATLTIVSVVERLLSLTLIISIAIGWGVFCMCYARSGGADRPWQLRLWLAWWSLDDEGVVVDVNVWCSIDVQNGTLTTTTLIVVGSGDTVGRYYICDITASSYLLRRLVCIHITHHLVDILSGRLMLLSILDESLRTVRPDNLLRHLLAILVRNSPFLLPVKVWLCGLLYVHFRSHLKLFDRRLDLFKRYLTIECVIANISGLLLVLLSIGESAAAVDSISIPTRLDSFYLHDRLLSITLRYLLAGRPAGYII